MLSVETVSLTISPDDSDAFSGKVLTEVESSSDITLALVSIWLVVAEDSRESTCRPRFDTICFRFTLLCLIF